jgi:hypothetical protein
MDVFSIAISGQPKETKQKLPYHLVFLSIPVESQCTFRIVGDPIVMVRRWIAQDPETKQWVPVWGYNPNDKRVRRPIILAVKRGNKWIGEYRNDPISRVIAQMQLPDEVKEQALRPDFLTLFPVFDVSRVVRQVAEDGSVTLVYPNVNGSFPQAIARHAELRNEPAILEFRGVPRIRDGVAIGEAAIDKLYQLFLSLVETDPLTGNAQQLDITNYLIVMKRVRGEGGKPLTHFLAQRPQSLPEITSYYDLTTWPTPVNHDALQQLLDGTLSYSDMLTASNIELLPRLVTVGQNEQHEQAAEEELFDD